MHYIPACFLLYLSPYHMDILIIHGPNLNLLGSREPEKYGTTSSEDILRGLTDKYPDIKFHYFQSNAEGEIINRIQEAASSVQGILINAGGFSHTSVAIADAVRSIKIPVMAVHITNIYQREDYRHTDIIGEACMGTIAGLGPEGYSLALECLTDKISAAD